MDRFRVVVNCIVYSHDPASRGSGNRYLILHRPADAKVYPNLWTVPGGGVEENDYRNLPEVVPQAWANVLEVVLRREVREEAGIEIGTPEFLSDFIFIRPDNIPVMGLRYAAPAISTDAKFNTREAQGLAWVSVDELDSYPFILEIPGEIRAFDARCIEKKKT